MTAERAPAMDRASLPLQLRLVSFIRLFDRVKQTLERHARVYFS